MKKFILGLLVVLFSVLSPVIADPGDAFPWGSEIRFPWKGIQGYWSTTIDGREAFVHFKIIKMDEWDSRQLKIQIIDASTCKVVARGVGYEDEKVVKGVMAFGSRSAKVTVHAFREADLKSEVRPSNRYNPIVTIMRLNSSGTTEVGTAYELKKVGYDLKAFCP